jgi:hypothetical protein
MQISDIVLPVVPGYVYYKDNKFNYLIQSLSNIHTPLIHVAVCEQNFSFFIFRSGLFDIRINCNWISKGFL